MVDTLAARGTLRGHQNWVTSIATTYDQSNLVVSASRDRTLMIWELTPTDRYETTDNEEQLVGSDPGYARRRLYGHGNGVSSVVLSSDGQFALSGSWDKMLRLWDLNTGATVRLFRGHEKDVFSVAFSSDNRQIVSGGRDRAIKLWNTLAECKFTMAEGETHTDWVSSVVFSPSAKMALIVSSGWDKLVKVWTLHNCTLRTNLVGHSGVVYTTSVSPDGSLCASGGKDGTAMLWDVNDGKHLYSLDAGGTINALCFSPKNYWLVAATDACIKVWDLENKNVLAEIFPNNSESELARDLAGASKPRLPWCVSLCWTADGNTLFAGCTDYNIHVYDVVSSN